MLAMIDYHVHLGVENEEGGSTTPLKLRYAATMEYVRCSQSLWIIIHGFGVVNSVE